MSIANLIVQPDRVFIITDSGFFNRDGTIAFLGPKTIVLPEISAAIAMTGGFMMGHLADQLSGRSFATIKDFLRELGPMMRAAYARANINPDTHWCRIVVAFYSHEHKSAHGCTMFTSRNAGPADLKPFAVYPIRKAFMPSVDENVAYGGEVDFLNPATFDPARHSMPLVEAQRRPSAEWAHLPGEQCVVAGSIDLTTVSASGIAVTTLHTYPDRVGERAGVA